MRSVLDILRVSAWGSAGGVKAQNESEKANCIVPWCYLTPPLCGRDFHRLESVVEVTKPKPKPKCNTANEYDPVPDYLRRHRLILTFLLQAVDVLQMKCFHILAVRSILRHCLNPP